MVVPYRERAYFARRPSIAVPPPGRHGGVIDLDGSFGFHPSLAPLIPLYERRELAVVHACGLVGGSRSHLQAQSAVESVLAGITEPSAPCIGARDALRASRHQPLQVTVVNSGVWDHHCDQGGTHGQFAAHLDDLARRLVALTQTRGAQAEDTVIVALSEFGRSIAENDRGGTEHGHGGAMLVIGSCLQGGRVHARWPGLGGDSRDLPVTTDIRHVLAEIVGGLALHT